MSAVAASAAGRIEQLLAVLDTVPDPEVPALSVRELGLVRALHEHGDAVEVVMTPTYSGCPATEVIAEDVVRAIDAAGLGPARVTMRLAPAWSSDWISETGRAKLLACGIAPPGPVASAARAGGGVPIRIVGRRADAVDCPRCHSPRTERLSAFGSTACKALYRCMACREPFEYFKPL